ncbi:MAG: TonB-dependent receptor [Paludibacteraceae bacterium]|nr:TonB-dependent receptor [Paludibacteraceae bacterium]
MKLHFRVFRTMSLAALLLLGMAAQARVVTGTVKDPTGETIISASVVVKGTTIGTVTDFDGNFSIDVPDDAKVLIFSYIGMQTQEVNITGNVMNVVLSENSEVLEEVVVTGYGTTKKRDLVTSVASVSAEQIKDVPVTTAAEALQGKLAGVSVVTTEGSPDADVKIRVRGGTSLTQSSDPLYIVDGFPVSSIADIAPGDIASMDVLKDAAATAIYGAQGANGVIIITTKEIDVKDEDKMVIHADYTGYMGWKKVASKYDMMDSKGFILMQKEWVHLNKDSQFENYFTKYFEPDYAETGGGMYSIQEIIDYWKDKEIDWQGRTFGNTGLNSNHSFSVSGGNKMAQFNLSYSRVDDKGILYGSDYDRNNISFKSKFTPIKNLTISVTARYSNTKVLGSGMNTAEDAGSKSESRVRNAVSYTPIPLDMSGSEMAEDEESIGSLYDPITTIDHNYKLKTDDKWSLNGYIQYKFLKHFTLKADLSYESRDVAKNNYYGPTTYYSRSGVSAYTSPGLGNVICTDEKTSRLKHTGSFDWKQSFDNHSFEIFAAEEVIIRKGEIRTIKGYGYDTKYTGETVFDHLGAADKYVANTYINPNDNMLSLIGRFDYNYAGRYYLTLTFRADASTKFTRGNQWGYFPSAALAWRIIDEPWMAPAQSVMSNLKLRATYGLVGNNNIELGYIQPEYLVSAASNSGIYSSQGYIGGDKLIAPNANLKWETTTSRNLGLDFGFWNERLSGTFDAYCNTTNDLLLLYRLPSGGYNYQYRNIGATQNIGVEFSLTGVILDHKSKDLSYGLTVTANIAHNNTIVKSLGGMSEYNVSAECFSAGYDNMDYEFKLVEGGRVGDIYGYKTDGFYTTDDFDGYDASKNCGLVNGEAIVTPFGNARPGMPKVVGDRQILGNTQPIVNGGFSLAFNIGGQKWGKVDLSTNFTYTVGNKVLNLSALDYSEIMEKTKLRNVSASLYNRYTYLDGAYNFIRYTGDYAAFKAQLDEVNVNATEANPISEKFALTDKYVEDASYLRLSSINIGYTLPQTVLDKAHMTTLRIFFTASNLFCVTKYSGADPEVDTRSKVNPLAMGVDFSAFPKNRAFNFGLSVGF